MSYTCKHCDCSTKVCSHIHDKLQQDICLIQRKHKEDFKKYKDETIDNERKQSESFQLQKAQDEQIIHELKRQLDDLSDVNIKFTSLQKQNENLKKQYNDSEEKCRVLTRQNLQLEETHKQREADVRASISEYKSQLTKLVGIEGECQRLEKTNHNLQMQIRDCIAESKKCQTERNDALKTLETERHKQNTIILGLNEQLTRLSAENVYLLSTHKELTANNHILKTEIDTLKPLYTADNGELKILRREYKSLESTYSQLKQDHNGMLTKQRNIIDNLTNAQSVSQKELLDTKQTLTTAEKTLKKLQAELAQRVQENKKYADRELSNKESLSAKTKYIDMLEKEYTAEKTQRISLSQALQKIEHTHNNCKETIETLNTTNKRLTHENSTCRSELDNVNKQLLSVEEALQTKEQTLKSYLKTRKEEIIQSASQLKALESKLERIQESEKVLKEALCKSTLYEKKYYDIQSRMEIELQQREQFFEDKIRALQDKIQVNVNAHLEEKKTGIQIKAENDQLHKELRTKNSRIVMLEKTVEDYIALKESRDSLIESCSAFKQQTQELADVKTMLSSAREQYTKLLNEKRELNAQVIQLYAQVEELSSALETKRKLFDECYIENEKLVATLHQIKKDKKELIDTIHSERKQHGSIVALFHTQLLEKENSISKQTLEMTEMKKRISHYSTKQKLVDELQHESMVLENHLQASKTIRDELEREMDDMKEMYTRKVCTLEKRIQCLETENAKLVNDLQLCEENLREAQAKKDTQLQSVPAEKENIDTEEQYINRIKVLEDDILNITERYSEKERILEQEIERLLEHKTNIESQQHKLLAKIEKLAISRDDLMKRLVSINDYTVVDV